MTDWFIVDLIGAAVVLATTAVNLVLAFHFAKVRHRIAELEVHPALSVASVPPLGVTPSGLLRVSTPPNHIEAANDVVAASAALMLTTGERVSLIRTMMARTSQSFDMLPDPAPTTLVEASCLVRRLFFEWIANDDPELVDEWWDCVEGVGRWER